MKTAVAVYEKNLGKGLLIILPIIGVSMIVSLFLGEYLSQNYLKILIGEQNSKLYTGAIAFTLFFLIRESKIPHILAENLYKYLWESSKNDNELFYSNNISFSLLKITDFLYSPKTQKEVFEQIVGAWQEEYFIAIKRKEIQKACWINVRFIYVFVWAMLMKSPLEDLIEFIKKIKG